MLLNDEGIKQQLRPIVPEDVLEMYVHRYRRVAEAEHQEHIKQGWKSPEEVEDMVMMDERIKGRKDILNFILPYAEYWEPKYDGEPPKQVVIGVPYEVWREQMDKWDDEATN